MYSVANKKNNITANKNRPKAIGVRFLLKGMRFSPLKIIYLFHPIVNLESAIIFTCSSKAGGGESGLNSPK